jgi:EAL domain-containing protein (putative c-di-GMP-specific phosphodiesterase class I)
LLFKSALQFGLYGDLEQLSWKKALEYSAQHLNGEKLFLNCNPYLVEGPKFLEIKSLFDKSQVNTNNVVLEITERSAISNSGLFYNNLNQYREHGFSFAIDDVGKGYSSLEVMVETKPEVVKIDRHIITDIHEDSFKRSIVKFIVSFCKDSGILSVAEGIESKKELDVVRDLGVNAGQGYFLFKPTPYIDRDAMCYTTSKLV